LPKTRLDEVISENLECCRARMRSGARERKFSLWFIRNVAARACEVAPGRGNSLYGSSAMLPRAHAKWRQGKEILFMVHPQYSCARMRSDAHGWQGMSKSCGQYCSAGELTRLNGLKKHNVEQPH